ncbi:MAG TPA: flagellar biosynthetic protein FliO [Acidobacteriota bacterium]|nr:flagellar biosynthetic protein FliO [Acidobacteriota bacterium]
MPNTRGFQFKMMLMIAALFLGISANLAVNAAGVATPSPDAPPGTEASPPPPPATPSQPAQPNPEPVTFPLKESPPLFSETNSNQPAPEPPGIGSLLGRTVLVLGSVIAVLVSLAWGLQRYGVNRTAQFGAQDMLTVLKVVPLGERRFLSVVRFGNQILLLGSTAQSITVLASHTEPTALSDTESTFSGCSVAEMLDSVNFKEP